MDNIHHANDFLYFVTPSPTETPTSVYGDSLKQQVEDRLKFYESGETPRKNIDVMKEAMGLAALETPPAENGDSAKKGKKKKDKKRKLEAENGDGDELNGTTNGGNDTTLNETTNGDAENGEPKKKKKKKKNKDE